VKSVPKQTFYNLSEEKRQNFINTALEEFALYDYNSASLNRIVDLAGIAKGSIYQYFENKRDLYQYLVEIAVREKFTYIVLNLPDYPSDFYELLNSLLLLNAEFDLKNPLKSKLFLNTINEKNTDLLGSFPSSMAFLSDEFVTEFIKYAAANNLLRFELDLDFAGFIINRCSLIIPDYLEKQHNSTYLEFILDGSMSESNKLEEIKNILIKFIDLFRLGFTD